MISLAEFPATEVQAWRDAAEAALRGRPLSSLKTACLEGFDLEPIYWPQDPLPPVSEAAPGAAPFLRGRGEATWRVCQRLGATSADALNAALSADMPRGQDAVAICLDPAGEVGTALNSAQDWQTALAGLDSAIVLHIDVGAGGRREFAPLLAYFDQVEMPQSGSLGFDPLALWLRYGLSPEADEADLATHAKALPPSLRPVRIDGALYHEAGAHAVQEMTFALATALAHLRRLEAAGLSPEETAARTSFTTALSGPFFHDIARLRALRWLWSRIQQACGIETLQPLHCHAATAQRNKSRLDPHVNLLRATVEGFAAVVGGVDSLEVSPFDGSGDEFPRRIARNLHTILREEAHLGRVADPAGGAWYVERLTLELAHRAWQQLQAIEAAGGMMALIERGEVQQQVRQVRQQRIEDLACRRAILVGVNQYANTAEKVSSEWAATSHQSVQDPQRLLPWRAAQPFERLRSCAVAHHEQTGTGPQVALVGVGALAALKPRIDFVVGVLTVGGIELTHAEPQADFDTACTAALGETTQAVVLCCSDEQWPEWVPLLKARLPQGATLLLAGDGGVQRQALSAAGVDVFVHRKCNVIELLERLHIQLGVSS